LQAAIVPYIRHNVNVTQSVGYISFDSEKEAQEYLRIITKPQIKMLIHLTRYGNFNNIMVLRHIIFDEEIEFTKSEQKEISKLMKLIKY
jgi:hypothetical protein